MRQVDKKIYMEDTYIRDNTSNDPIKLKTTPTGDA